MNTLILPPNSHHPLTPSSSRRPSSSIKQKVRPAPYHLRPESDSQLQFPKARPSIIKTQHSSPLYSLPSPSHPPSLRSQEVSLQRTSSLPTYPAISLPTAPPLEVPYFGQPSSKSESSPLVFSPTYISNFLNKSDDDEIASSSRCTEQHQLLTPHPVCEGKPGLQRCQSESLVHARRATAPRPIIIAQPPAGQYTISITPTSGSHPALATSVEHHDVLASARTTLLGTGSAYGHSLHAPEEDKDLSTGDRTKLHMIRLLEEKHKQKYAIELIEQALATVNRIWPETIEPSLSTAERKPFLVVTPSTPMSPITPAFPLHVRSQVLQQATPDSSPASTSKKRKRASPSDLEFRSADLQSNKRRAGFHPGMDNRPTALPVAVETAEPSSELKSAPSTTSSSPITLRLFVRELLRRSKTHCSTLEVALCYLDGVEETVKRLKDCYKLGMAFGTVAMAEKGVYEEGMKDEKRIISLEEEAAESAGLLGYLDHQCHEDTSWTPISPESDFDESKMNLATPKKSRDSAPSPVSSSPASSLNILASHPLLDPRRSFLAALVIATKFLQDRAYSNKAWAKLSGLPAQEIGRCERALGGALGWRVWVGKDFGRSSSSPQVSSLSVHRSGEAVEEVGAGGMEVGSTEEGTNSDDVVHGLNDPIAESFIAAAANAQAQAAAKVTVSASAPSNVATASNTTAAAAGVWSRAMSWPCFIPSTSTSAASSAPSSATWVSDEYLNLDDMCLSKEPLALSTSATATHFIEPNSLAASLEIINSMLDLAEAKSRSASRSSETTMPVRSGTVSAAPSTPETIIVPGNHHLPQPITAGKTPVMPMCGTFLHCSPLQMDTGVPPYPFSFVPPTSSTHRSSHSQTLSPSPTLLHPGFASHSSKLSPFSAGLRSGGSCRSGGSTDSTSFLSPDEIDTPPPHLPHSGPQTQVKIAVDRQATLVDHHMEFSLDGLTSLGSDAYVKPQRYLVQPLPHPLQDRRQYPKGPSRLYEQPPITHIPPASLAF